MARRPTRSVPTVVIPGWNGSGPDHWQTWLEQRLAEDGRETRRPPFADVDHPELAAWLDDLRTILADLPADGFDVVAHSLGVVLWLHHVVGTPGTTSDGASSPRPARVLLVSPPSPSTAFSEVAAFFPPPLDIDTVRRSADGTALVSSDNDPYLPEGIAAAYASPLKMATTIVPGGKHLNGDAGYGEWPAVRSWCRRDNLAFY